MPGERMTPDEENWASWKCDGGPHIDWVAHNNPNNIGFARPVTAITPTQEPQIPQVPEQLEVLKIDDI